MVSSVELACDFPSGCISTQRDRRDLDPQGFTRVRGFIGDRLVQWAGRLGPGSQPPTDLRPTRHEVDLLAAKREFARVVLGMFGTSHSFYPLRFSISRAQVGGQAYDWIDGTAVDGFLIRLSLDRQTHLPVMVSWQAPGLAAGDTLERPLSRRVNVEHLLRFADYKLMNGVRVPMRIEHVVDGSVFEQTTFTEYRINEPIDPTRFEIPR